jgi:hypothetical protein
MQMVPSQVPEELRELLIALVDGRLGQDEADRLDDILRDHPDRQEFYGWFMALHGMLLWRYSPTLPDGDKSLTGEHASSIPHVQVVRAGSSPVAGFFPTTVHGTFGYFSAGWPVAYLIATVIFGIGLLVGGLVRVSQPERVAVVRPVQEAHVVEPQVAAVGRITGMANCRWANGVVPLSFTDVLSVGTQIKLDAGLMEITYDTGAKVVLQGPVTYEVESPAAGFLSLGRLTARLENSKTKDQRPKTEDSHPSSLIPHPLFVVRTPTATVTDLGTEFGVEVDKQGVTTSHVFRGSVRVQRTSIDGTVEPDGRIVGKNETVRVESFAGSRQIVTLRTFTPSRFVRELRKRTIKSLDLADVVAGGNGFTGRRNAGIDPRDGLAVPDLAAARRFEQGAQRGMFPGDGKYHRVAALPFIDGVFIPDGTRGPVQVDSAGHRFEGFPETANVCGGVIFVGGVLPFAPPGEMQALPATLNGVDYSSPGHGFVFLHANKGITFDLEAIRRANPGFEPVRFRAVAGNTGGAQLMNDVALLADLWVLVDGKWRWRRREVNAYNGGFAVSIPISRGDRFLTLAATDGGNRNTWEDFTMFCDPRLELAPVQSGSETAVSPR